MQNQQFAPSKPFADILARIAAIGPFLPGSVRKTSDKRRNAAGEPVVYEGQPLFNFRGKDVRIPKAAYEEVKRRTENYKAFQALVAEFEEAAVRAWLPKGSKKTAGRSR